MTKMSHRTRLRIASGALFLLIVAVLGALSNATVPAALPGGVGPPAVTSPLQDRAPADQPDVRLAVAGDVGTGAADARAVAATVAASGRLDPFDALILLGDNVYPDGDAARLDATIFGPYGPVLASGAKLLPILGNHDVGFADAQMSVLGMPGRWYRAEVGNVLFIGLDSNDSENPSQVAWLDATLAASEAEWTIVALHHPPFSAGVHGSDAEAREAFVPIFERHGVDLVLAGHDHDYQRSVPIGETTYVVSGAGAKVRKTGTADFTAASAATLHFVEVAVWDDRLQLRAVGLDGVFDSATIDRSAAPGPPAAAFALSESWLTDEDTSMGARLAGLGAILWIAAICTMWLAPRAANGRLGAVLTVASTAAVLSVISGIAIVAVGVIG